MTLSITPYTISTLILIVIIDAIITSGGKVLASLIQSNGNNNLPPTPLPSQCTWPINNTNGSASDQWIVCVPPEDTWNGNVVVFTHGYVLYTTPAPYMPWDMFYIDGQVAIWDVLLNQRFAFAASTFRKNGLAVLEGVEDTETLITWFRTKYPTTKRVYALGVSMGGQISAKLCTTNTNSQQSSSPLVDGCLVACSPIGSYIGIINYWGDYRTVFDYFFPGVLPGNSVDVPDALLEDWLSENSIYQKAVIEAISSDKEATLQLLSVTSSPIGPLEFDTFVPSFDTTESVIDTLTLIISATTANQLELSCQPYDNIGRTYHGSLNDKALNAGVLRYNREGPENCTESYEISPLLERPFVAMHNVADPCIPYSQLIQFRKNVGHSGSLESVVMFTGLPVLRYGHCSFTEFEV